MDASSKKQEIDEAIVKFDDEQQEKKDNENIDDEIKKVLDSAQKLIDLLEKIAPDINSDKVVNPKAFLKIIIILFHIIYSFSLTPYCVISNCFSNAIKTSTTILFPACL